MRLARGSAQVSVAALAFAGAAALAQDARKEIEKYQRMVADSSPVELFELEGEALWKKDRKSVV